MLLCVKPALVRAFFLNAHLVVSSSFHLVIFILVIEDLFDRQIKQARSFKS